MKISTRQREVLQFIHGSPGSRGYWGNIPDRVWFSFAAENAVQRFLENMQDRGLITIERIFFYTLTEKGKAVLNK